MEALRGKPPLIVCSPDENLGAIVSRLSRVTGLPVVDKDNKIVGVISRKDIIRMRKQGSGSMQDPVSKHMTTPAVTVPITAGVQEAADLMLRLRIRRLPVVDEAGGPAGILSRSDIFRPLFMEQYMEYQANEVAQVQGFVSKSPSEANGNGSAATASIDALKLREESPAPAAGKTKKTKKITWSVKYLYDGDCAMCQSLKTVLERQDNGKGRIKFVNIADASYNPSKNMGVEYEEAMQTVHAIKPSGEILYGTDALRALFTAVGLGWAADLSAWPLLTKIVDAIYHFLSANRISLGGAFDAIIAAKRVEMSKKGIESCGDLDEQCAVEW